MFVDFQVAFVMFSFCYAQWPSYLQHIIFPSLNILQHYTKFDACTIVMLEKLLMSQPHFWKSVRMTLTLSKWGFGSPLGLQKL